MFGFKIDFSDIFGSFFGGGRQSSRTGPRKGQDIEVRPELTFEEAALGCEKQITVSRMESCVECEGSGAKKGTSADTCSKCGGTGQIRQQQRTVLGDFMNVTTCPACGGTGKIIKEPCAECGARGQVKKTAKITVKVPAGIDSDQTMTLRGEGNAGSLGGPPGDLYVTIRIKKHILYERKGSDVYCNVPVTFVEAALGCEIDVPTLHGTAKLKIPEGTQNSTTFRMRGEGMQKLRGSGKGDQFVKILVEVPKSLNSKQKQLLKEFGNSLGTNNFQQKKGFFENMKDFFRA